MQFLIVLLDNNIVSEINNIFGLPNKYLLFTVPRDWNLACTRVLYLVFSFFISKQCHILDDRTNSSVGFVGQTVLTESFYNEFWIRNPFLKVWSYKLSWPLNVRFVVHNSKKKSVLTFIKRSTGERQRSVNMEVQSLIKIGWEANR